MAARTVGGTRPASGPGALWRSPAGEGGLVCTIELPEFRWTRRFRGIQGLKIACQPPRRAANADLSGTIQEKVDGAKRRLHQMLSFRG
jgi:hypothetical protein